MEYREKIFVICLGFSRSYEDAEELTQEVYLKALKKITTLKNPKLARSWLVRIARNTCLDHAKKKHRRQEWDWKDKNEAVEYNTPETLVCQKQGLLLLKRAIRRLPKKLREVFILREYGELSYREISQALSIKEGTVMSRLNRARVALVDKISEGSHE